MENKLIAIVGPTASGKTDLAKALYRKFSGVVISVDSRQIYQKLDIGTGKDKSFLQEMIDIVSPEENFSVVRFQQKVLKTIDKVFLRGKVPFLVGGTGFYLDSVIFQREYPQVAPNEKLRSQYNKKTIAELFGILKTKDVESAKRTGKNKRRLIRALEIIEQTGKTIPIFQNNSLRFPSLILGIKIDSELLYQRIDERVDERIKDGMIAEVRDLIQSGVSRTWLKNLGLEYRFITEYLEAKTTRDKMIQQLKFAIHGYARRQMTWWRRYPNIKWLELKNFTKQEIHREAEKLVKQFLNI
ncbi:tRNA (adenosine(37)-N6)-dimethylallyltransferase MiaA [Candidatus Berkelbacteria bacterium CG_4_9_14_3_um_filter_39_23]|uniref:tRNA dimethylallyltransferase n=3 Tax=Candidatus Berkelbacteria TaxID=1618330 RepID=A0A2M7CHQ7_9BACT|nr:MAG: tRNA (adenosine(37)-N6)-dimethylallyltransferase MiaA [Candidatus Berkelbacteria bacterium CG1_02_42_45]OIP05360.1 MAG: tRNA (adenosine(37)-N6)-dimethylallyltransferase MiaA [Candidatus Berkelbacteria bacterium CG2_30_39_44]PIV25184.1 MAG: tRNA (adenosine(37)-N6)-dimethylallyltransferase MiaA [Candidatus Berkelbacteria bacterium CG03_land_8_20_14_0_80_40_36]PIX30758.1 MAG: tRNA (adenosine(37)-N6)-dimethylallyltransferase MiaA [Candidatus Berkelbacteria bacterium CG_4_8_14_3_um_filter_39_